MMIAVGKINLAQYLVTPTLCEFKCVANSNLENFSVSSNTLETKQNVGQFDDKMSMPAQTQNQSGTAMHSQLAERSLGVNIHTRPMGGHSKRPGAVTVDDRSVICEPNWDILSWVERPQVIDSVQWTTSQTAHTVLMSLELPADLLVTPFLKAPFDAFLYWNGEMEFHLQTSGTPFHQGTIVMFYVPGYDPTEATGVVNAITSNFCAITSIQHTILHANTSTSACMTIPFINANTYIDYQKSSFKDAAVGSLVICVFNPLIVASGASTSVNVSLVAQMKNSSFKIPRFRAEGLIETVLGTSGGKLIQRMLPQNIIADSIDTVLGVFGLDRPTSIERMAPMKMIGTNYMNSVADIDYIDKMSMFPSKLQETDATIFGVSDNEMLFDHLKQKYSYVGTFQQTTSYTPGSLLAAVPITPIVVPLIDTTSGTAPFNNNINNVPLLEYLCFPFKYWKGGLTYKIQVVATSFHNTKIFAAIQYGRYGTPTPLPITQATNQYGFAFEVNQGSTEFEFTVPYVTQRPQLEISGGGSATSYTTALYNDFTTMGTLCIYVLNELAVSNNVSTSISYNLYIAGASDFSVNTLALDNMSVVPINPYLVPAVTFSSLEINSAPFVAECRCGTSIIQSTILDTDVRTSVLPFVAESILSSPFSDTNFQKQDNVISPCENVSKRKDINEQGISSIVEPLKKYNLFARASYDNSTPTNNYQIINCSDVFRPPVNVDSTYFVQPNLYTFPYYYASMYGGFRGPLRFKIVLESAPIGDSFKVYYFPPPAPNATFSGTNGLANSLYNTIQALDTAASSSPRPYLQLGVCNSTQKTLEFEVPFSTAFKYINLDHSTPGDGYIATGQSLLNGYVMIVFDPDASFTSSHFIRYDIYVAFGDESKLGIFIGVPSVIVPVNSTTGTNVFPVEWGNTAPPQYVLAQL